MTLLAQKELDGVTNELVYEIRRHLHSPITLGEVNIPLIVDDAVGDQIALALATKVRAEFTDGQMLDLMTQRVHVAIKGYARIQPHVLRGNTCLIYVYQPKEGDHEDLIRTMENTLFTARFKGLGGHIVRI